LSNSFFGANFDQIKCTEHLELKAGPTTASL